MDNQTYLINGINWTGDKQTIAGFSDLNAAMHFAKDNCFNQMFPNFEEVEVVNSQTNKVLYSNNFQFQKILDDAQSDIKRYHDNDSYHQKMSKIRLDAIAKEQRRRELADLIERRQKFLLFKKSEVIDWVRDGF